MQNAFPVPDVLLAKRSVKTIQVPRGGDICRRRTFAQHLLDGISRNEVDEQEDKADHKPDDRQSIEDALEDTFQFSVLSCRS